MSIFYKNGILVLNVLLAGLTLLSYCSSSIHPADSGLIAIAGLVYPLLILLNVLFIIYWLFLNKRNALISGIVLLIGIFPLMRLLTLNVTKSVETGVKVASFNCNFLKSTWAEKEDETAQGLCIDFLGSLSEVDIFCLQEYGERSEVLFEEALSFPFKYRYTDKTLAIYSKFPVQDSDLLDIKANDAHSCIWIDVDVPQIGRVRIYNVHMQSNRHDGVEVDTIIEGAPEVVNPTIMTGLLKHYQKFSSKRVQQAQMITQNSGELSHAYLVCGDMNDTPQSYMYQVFSSDMRDAFIEAGNGFGFSYSGGIPFLRLDYIFASSGLRVVEYESTRTKFSDHDVVLATITNQ